MSGCVAQQGDDPRVQVSLRGQPLLQLAQLRCCGEPPEPEQVTGFFKRGMVRQFVDVDAAIRQYAAISVDVANPGSGGNDALKSLGGLSCGDTRHWSHAPRWIFVAGPREE